MTILQTASGRAFDLVNPTPDMVDFTVDVPEMLSAIARFNGAPRHMVYSVAQHCCLGANVILRETCNADLVRYFLLHDAHEAYIGDIATPVAQALEYVSASCRGALQFMKTRVDIAIHAAAGIPCADLATRHEIHVWDLRMLAAERAQLLTPCGALENAWAKTLRGLDPAPLDTIHPWTRDRAAGEWRDRFQAFFPAASRLPSP
jgi:hypothetical protein